MDPRKIVMLSVGFVGSPIRDLLALTFVCKIEASAAGLLAFRAVEMGRRAEKHHQVYIVEG